MPLVALYLSKGSDVFGEIAFMCFILGQDIRLAFTGPFVLCVFVIFVFYGQVNDEIMSSRSVSYPQCSWARH